MNKQQYQEFLQSNHWKTFTRQAKQLYNNKCWFCNSNERLQTHHLRYYKKTFYTNRLAKNNMRWFVVLCSECHINVHSFIKVNNLETRLGTKLYQKIYYPGKKLQMTQKQIKKNAKLIEIF